MRTGEVVVTLAVLLAFSDAQSPHSPPPPPPEQWRSQGNGDSNLYTVTTTAEFEAALSQSVESGVVKTITITEDAEIEVTQALTVSGILVLQSEGAGATLSGSNKRSILELEDNGELNATGIHFTNGALRCLQNLNPGLATSWHSHDSSTCKF